MSRPNKAFGQVAKQQDFAVEIDDTDSPYTTNGETQIYVDTSTAAVTVQLATADLAVGKSIDIYDDGNNAATNNISITTEGSATFVPGGVASLTIDTDGAYRQVRGGSTNWFADLNAQRLAVATEQIGSERHYAGAYSGSDVDARLDNALSAAAGGDVIYLENGNYDSAHTIGKSLTLVGANFLSSIFDASGTGLTVSATDVAFSQVWFRTTVDVNAVRFRATDCRGTTDEIQIGGNKAIIHGHQEGSVTFESGTSGGIVDASQAVSVTDNGTNTVGDIS